MAENGKVRVRALIVDDEELGRRMLRTMLAADKDLQVVGEAASAADARRQIAERRVAGGGEPARKYVEQMTIRVRRRMFSLEVGDITWIQGASQYSRVHTRNDEYLLSRTLHSLEGELDPRRFFRIHRSAIVNAAHVHEVRSNGDGRYSIYLNGGLALPMGRARREILDKLLTGIGSRG